VRFAYNKALHISRHMYQRHGVSVSIKRDLKPLLAVGKKSRRYSWLKEYDSLAMQQAVINLDTAFGNFFKKRAHFPSFKSKHGKQSSYHPNGKVLTDAIQLPKMKSVRANIHREIVGKVSSITISRNATGKYFASILCDDGQEPPEKPGLITCVTGYDMGLSHYLIPSSGDKVNNPRHLINASRNLRRKQKALSRKKRGSANRSKARLLLAAVHERVANARADFQHKLARAIGDAAWQGFIMKVEYKAAAEGVHLVKLNQWFASSKTCHCCGHKMADMPLHKRIWQCPTCNIEHDRNINAAMNIQNKGITELMAAGLVVTAHRGQCKSVIKAVAA